MTSNSEMSRDTDWFQSDGTDDAMILVLNVDNSGLKI